MPGPLPEPTPALDPQFLSLAELELSVRATNCLESAGIVTVGDLCRRSPLELLEIRNFGETTFREVIEKLADRKLRLRAEEAQPGD